MDKEPTAWIYELASCRDMKTGEYSVWGEYLTKFRPKVPEKSIRNLRPLYVAALKIEELRAENERLRQALSWLEDHEPVLVDQAKEKFGLDLQTGAFK